MPDWKPAVDAVTLFTEDLPASRAFYADVFGADPIHEDEASSAYRFGGTVVNLLDVGAAPELVEPAEVAPSSVGARIVLTIEVDDVDSICQHLAARGVELLNGPMDRPWGIRTASFRDPSGHIWEISS